MVVGAGAVGGFAAARLADAGYDAIVLGVKSDDLEGAMADIGAAVKPPAVIIPFLNGMAHVEVLTGRFGSAVLGGVLRVATERILNRRPGACTAALARP